MLTDTHAHLDFPDFAADVEAVVERALAAGVSRIISIGTTVDTSRNAVAMAHRFAPVYATVGLHPNHAHEAAPDAMARIRELAAHPKVVGIGEAGLDYYRLPEEPVNGWTTDRIKERQAEIFEAQMKLATELGLNVVVHQRESWADCIALVRRHSGGVQTVFHCFGGGPEQATELVGMGHRVSYTGIITFKNAQTVREGVASLPSGTLMVETDCPYLAPVPYRGQRCEPAYTRQVAEKVAEVRKLELPELAEEMRVTTERFFRFTR